MTEVSGRISEHVNVINVFHDVSSVLLHSNQHLLCHKPGFY